MKSLIKFLKNGYQTKTYNNINNFWMSKILLIFVLSQKMTLNINKAVGVQRIFQTSEADAFAAAGAAASCSVIIERAGFFKPNKCTFLSLFF